MGAIVGTTFALIFGLLGSGIWVGMTLMASGVILLAIFRDMPLERLLPQYTWNILTTSELLALPLFIIMGELLFRTKLSRSLFQGLAPWAGLLPGRLLHVNIFGCSIFAAISGSSAATTQVVGRIALDELTRRGYDKRIAIGSLAGAGTLGFLIPPSNILIIYGVLGEVSILKLFTAGFIPGFLLAACFMAWVMIHTTLDRSLIPESERALRSVPWSRRFAALKELGPVIFLIICVLGSMYGGIATPSEAAAVGVLGAVIVGWLQGAMNWRDDPRRQPRLGPDLQHDRADRAGRLDPRQRHGLPGRAARRRRLRRRPRPVAVHADHGADGVLRPARLLPRRLQHDRHDAADRAADREGRGLRPDLVRHLPGARRRDGADHAAGRLQPLRDPGPDQTRA
jgi:hypothetical protein